VSGIVTLRSWSETAWDCSERPAAAAMGAYPLILVPTFAVPVAVLLHLVALRRLRRSPRPVAGAAPDLALT